MAVKEPEKTTDPTDDASATSDLAALAAELGKAGADAEKASAAADAILERINDLDEDAQNRLMAKPLVQKLLARVVATEHAPNKADPPGTIYYKTAPGGDKSAWSKKPYSWADLYNPPPPKQPMPLKTWEPAKTMLLAWQGLFVTVMARQEVTLPEVFYGVYRDAANNERLGEQHAAYLMKKGGLPSDPSIVTANGARARSLANHDGSKNVHQPGGGLIADWSPELMSESA